MLANYQILDPPFLALCVCVHVCNGVHVKVREQPPALALNFHLGADGFSHILPSMPGSVACQLPKIPVSQ